MPAETLGTDIARYTRFGTAVTLNLVDSFLLSPVRNIQSEAEKGKKEGFKSFIRIVGIPIAAAALTYTLTKRSESVLAAGFGAYLLEGLVYDYREFRSVMRDPLHNYNTRIAKLVSRIYPEGNKSWTD